MTTALATPRTVLDLIDEYDQKSAGVVQAAGLHASRLGGAPLIYNRLDPYLPDLLMCRTELAGTLLDTIHAAF